MVPCVSKQLTGHGGKGIINWTLWITVSNLHLKILKRLTIFSTKNLHPCNSHRFSKVYWDPGEGGGDSLGPCSVVVVHCIGHLGPNHWGGGADLDISEADLLAVHHRTAGGGGPWAGVDCPRRAGCGVWEPHNILIRGWLCLDEWSANKTKNCQLYVACLSLFSIYAY